MGIAKKPIAMNFSLLVVVLFVPAICLAQKENCSIAPTAMVVWPNSTLAASQRSDLLLMLKAVSNEDEAGMAALTSGKVVRVVMLELGTKVKVRCTGELDLLSIESGEQIGLQLWVVHGMVVSEKKFEQVVAKQAEQAVAEQKAADASALEKDRVRFLQGCDEQKNGMTLSKEDFAALQKACEELRSGTSLATVRGELAARAQGKENARKRLESLAECDTNDAAIEHQGFALSNEEALRKKCADVRSGKLHDLQSGSSVQ